MRAQDGVIQRIVSTEKACLSVVEMAPGTVIESHKHDVDQVGTVTKGQIVLVIAGEQRVLVPGDSYRVPAGIAHGARVLHEATTVVDCYAPPPEDLRRAYEQDNVPKVKLEPTR